MTEVIIKQSGKRGNGWWIAAIVIGAIGFARIVPRLDNSMDADTYRAQEHRRAMETIRRNPIDAEKMEDAIQSSSKQFFEDQAKRREPKS